MKLGVIWAAGGRRRGERKEIGAKAGGKISLGHCRGERKEIGAGAGGKVSLGHSRGEGK